MERGRQTEGRALGGMFHLPTMVGKDRSQTVFYLPMEQNRDRLLFLFKKAKCKELPLAKALKIRKEN